jgi:hypothetical protein
MNLEQRTGLVEQEADKGDEVEADERLGQPFVVLRQSAEAGCPGETTG